MLKSFFGDAKLYFISKILQGISFLICLKLYTYFLNPIEFGQYSTVLVTTTIFLLFTTTWINAAMIRLSHGIEEPLGFTQTGFTLNIYVLIGGGGILTMILSFFSIFSSLNWSTIIIVVVYYFSLGIFNFLLVTYSIVRNVSKYSYYLILQTVLSIFFAWILLEYKKDYSNVFFAHVISLFIVFTIIFKEIKCFFKKLSIKKEYFNKILKYGLPVIFIQLFVSLTMFSDQLILKYFGFHEQVGIYAANYTLVDKSINIISSVFITSFQPILFGLWEKETPQKAYAFFKKILSIYILIATTICLGIFFTYDIIVKYILTPSFNIGNLFIYIMLGSVLLSLSNFFSEILNANQKTGLIAFIYGIAFAVSFITNMYYVPSMGMRATTHVNILSYSVLFIGMVIASSYYIRRI